MVTAAFTAIEGDLRGSLMDWYRARGDLRFAYAAGSLVEGLASEGDVDVTVIWGSVPEAVDRPPVALADDEPPPATFHLPNFKLDRFFIRGQQVDVKHASIEEFEWWVAEVESGRGVSGYPMPVIALHAFTSSVILADDGTVGTRRAALGAVPSLFVEASTRRAREAVPAHLAELARCVERGDGLLFHSQCVELVRTLFIAWFARRGLYWPHEKRLSTRLELLGERAIAEAERSVWAAPTLTDRAAASARLADLVAFAVARET